MRQRSNTGNLQSIEQNITATSLHSVEVAPGHEIKFYEFGDNDLGVNEILDVDQHTPILKRLKKSPSSAVELFRLINPKAEIPQSLVEADARSANAAPDDNTIADDEVGGDSDALPDSPRSEQRLVVPSSPALASPMACPNDGYWHSWDCDAQWFTSNFCNTGDKRFCPTNAGGWAWSQKTGGQMNVTGMAAGFNTVARFVIRRRKCSLFDGCSWKIYVDTILQPRTYSHWYFSKSYKRHARIDTTSGEPRIHFAMTYNSGSNPPSTPLPYSEYAFCVSSAFYPRTTWRVTATNWTEAESILRNQLGTPTAGSGGWAISQGAC
jgi:hypothetical protein